MLDGVTEEQLGCWAEELAILLDGLGHLFARPEPREVFADVVQGLLSDAKRKNGWTVDAAQRLSPVVLGGCPHLLGRDASRLAA
jgi:hypothetical protein